MGDANMSDVTSINAILIQNAGRDKPNNLKLAQIPKALENISRTQILRGEVTGKTNDGAIYIKTDKGEIKAQIDPNIQIKKGDYIELRIGKGNPPQYAYIKLALKLPMKEIQPQNLEKNLTHINNITAPPQNLSAEKLIAKYAIRIDLLTPQMVQKLTSPYIDEINMTMILPTITKVNMGKDITPHTLVPQNIVTQSPVIQNLNEIIPPSILEIFSPQKPIAKNIEASFKMSVPITQIPLRAILTQIIASPAEEPINISSHPIVPPAPPAFTEVSVKSMSPPLAQIEHVPAQEIPNERAGEFRAVLAGFTQDKNLPAIKIITPQNHGEQYYALQTPIEDIPLGTQIELIISKSIKITPTTSTITANALQTSMLPMPVINHNFFVTPEIWSVMQEITQVLNQANPVAAQGFSNIMPNPATPAQLGSAAMFFLAAMRSGDVQSWLGERAVEIIKRADKYELITRLSGEFSALSRMGSEGTAHEWRSLSLPLAWQNEIHKMIVHYRKEGQSGSDSGGNSGRKTRFVMDLNLSNIGKLQLDGLFIASPNGAGRLDLILRTEQSFSESMKVEMRQKYKSALDETSFTGELSFQNKPDQWVSITQDAAPEFSKDI